MALTPITPASPGLVLVRAEAALPARGAGEGYSGPLLGPAANPEQVADRVFWPSSEQREARRRELLVQLEEEQRRDAMGIGQKTTGATFEGFETSRQLESGPCRASPSSARGPRRALHARMACHDIHVDAGDTPRDEERTTNHWKRRLGSAPCVLGLGFLAVGAIVIVSAGCSESVSDPTQTCSGGLDIGHVNLSGTSLPAKTLALTFDDGPGLRTSELSSYLKSQGIRATFFINGRMITNGTDILAQLADDGHLIGNHTQNHVSFTGQSTNTSHLGAADIVDEITQTDTLIAPFVSDNHFLFRAPYGDFDEEAADAINASPMAKYVGPINWDIGSQMGAEQAADWACWHPPADDAGVVGPTTSPKDCGDLYAMEIDAVGHGIVLMHDPYFINDDPAQGGTVDMVQYLVPILKAKGYQFVRADEVPDIAALLPADASDAGADQDAAPIIEADAGARGDNPDPCPASPQNDTHYASGESGNLRLR